MNGGICNMYPTGGKCVCMSNFTGDYCQFKNTSFGVFEQLINSSFSLDVYRKSRPLFDEFFVYNGTIDASVVSDAITRDRINQYLSLYPNGTMRFDMLVNYLIQDYLSLIYPWQFFLQEFGYQSEVQMGYINAIPSLLLSSKYAYDKYDQMWAVYEDVLKNLVNYLPKHLPNIRQEAELFFQIYEGIFAQFEKTGNFSGFMASETNTTFVTIDILKNKIRRDFNETLGLSFELFRTLSSFDQEIGVRAAMTTNLNASFIEQQLFNFTVDEKVISMIGNLSETNAEIWDSLSFHGFWYVVSEFVSADLLKESRNMTFMNGDMSRMMKTSWGPKGTLRFSKTSKNVTIAQALIGDNFSMDDENTTKFADTERLFGTTNGTAAQLIANATFVMPQHLIGTVNTTNVPVAIPSHLLGKTNTSWSLTARLMGTPVWNTTVSHVFGNTSFAVAQHLIGNTTLAKTAHVFGNTTTTVQVPIPSHLIGTNSTLTIAAHVLGTPVWNTTVSHVFGNTTVAVPEHLMGATTPVPVTVASQLVGTTTPVPVTVASQLEGTTIIAKTVEKKSKVNMTASHLSGNSTIVKPESLISSTNATVIPVLIPSHLLGTSNTTIIAAAHVLGTPVWNATVSHVFGNTTFAEPEQLLGDSSFPSAEHVFGTVNSTIVPVAVPSHLIGTNATLTIAAHVLGTPVWNTTVSRVFGNTTFAVPEHLMGTTTPVPVTVASQLVGTTTPVPVTVASQLVGTTKPVPVTVASQLVGTTTPSANTIEFDSMIVDHHDFIF